MSDEKLHPEVEALIAKGPNEFMWTPNASVGLPVRAVETDREFARRIALLAASKAREEERERCAKVCDALASRLEDRAYEHRLCADKSVSNSDTNAALYLRDAAVAIRRGKP